MRRWVWGAAVVAMLVLHSTAGACELCRDSTAVAARAGAAPVALSYNSSIIWMLGALVAVGTFAGASLTRAVRQDGDERD